MNTSVKAFAQLSALIFFAFTALTAAGESPRDVSVFLTFVAVAMPLVSRKFRMLYMRAYGFVA